MESPINLGFNPAWSSLMHLDLNSCFATIEQQANPFLRDKPLAVAAYNSPGGCILAASKEAKKLGIKTGMRLRLARQLCPKLRVLEPDPDKYRSVHLALREIVSQYTPVFAPKSIDEFVLDFGSVHTPGTDLKEIGQKIKARIRSEIGEAITVSIGLGPNRFLAKTASNLVKPDGLEEINKGNFLSVYEGLGLTDLTGINVRNEIRLKCFGIRNVSQFYRAPLITLKAAFASILGYYWYARLRGWEVDSMESARQSFGNSFAFPHSQGTWEEIWPVLMRLTEKTGFRMRKAGYGACGVAVFLSFKDHSFWHKSQKTKKEIFDSREIYQMAKYLFSFCPEIKPVHTLAVSCFNLKKKNTSQLEIFDDVVKRRSLISAVDSLNLLWGDFTVKSPRSIQGGERVQDRIAFGGIREL